MADLEKEGVGKSERDYLLAYLRKVGSPWGGEIIKHQSMYIGEGGVGQEFRGGRAAEAYNTQYKGTFGTSAGLVA